MWTISDLGRLIKEANPGEFDGLTDEQVGRAAKRAAAEKGSHEFDDYVDTAPVVRQQPIPPKVQTGLTDKLQKVWQHDPEMGGIIASFRTWQREAQNKLMQSLSQRQSILLERASQLTDFAIKEERNQAELNQFIELNKYDLEFLKIDLRMSQVAAEQGLSSQAWIEVNKEKELSGVRLEERWKQYIQDSDALDLEAIAPILVIKKMVSELEDARRKRYELDQGDDPPELKKQLLADCDKFIKNLQRQINEAENRLIQKTNRKNLRGKTAK